jgi:proteasome lid subunit RPN8/RPN11
MSQLQWTIPAGLLDHSVTVMRPHGVRGNEGLALWFGRGDERRVQITLAVEVCGAGFRTTPLFMSLSMRAMAALTDLAEKHGVFLAGQIHSHPGSFIDLSELDEAQGIRTPNYLSVVCPYYAQRDVTDLHECGVHVFEGVRYRRLAADEIMRRIVVVNAPLATLRLEVPG